MDKYYLPRTEIIVICLTSDARSPYTFATNLYLWREHVLTKIAFLSFGPCSVRMDHWGKVESMGVMTWHLLNHEEYNVACV